MSIEVLVEYGILKNDGILTYHVPKSLENEIKVGKRVFVPLNNHDIVGFVMKIHQDKEYDFELKDISSVIDEEAVLNDELLELGKYLKETTMSSLISCYQVMFPKAYKASKTSSMKAKEESYLSLNKTLEEVDKYINTHKRAVKQIELLNALKNSSELKRSLYPASLVNTLLEAGIIKEEKKEIYRLKHEIKTYRKLTLTKEQQSVVTEVTGHLNETITYLLHGVTGSGKTEVYLQIIEEVLNKGKQVIVLVPEISLTPQMVERFVGRFGSLVAILHSRLSNGERYDEYRKILRKEVDIVVGARSAIFAPFTNLGLIVIDEEHESTYKQDSMHPYYHALDVAKKRSETHNCPVLLGSATPSLESYARADKGVYKLLELKTRISNHMPSVTIVNMLNEMKKREFVFSRLLQEKINDRLAKGEQIILLLNRRGYSSYMMCSDCGYVHKCPNCDISLTFHKNSGMMRCHYCNYADNRLYTCPECSSKKIRQFGTGTEKIEEELITRFKARVVRMDFDTTSKKGAHEQILKDFKEHKYDILLGTQMIAKGLDFENVTLVGVLNSDTSLNFPDFRSSERTFQLLSQVAGRAGRSTLPGEVVIQTCNDTHYSILYAKDHDYYKFYRHEMMIRRTLKYPPYCYLVLLRVMSKDYDLAYDNAKKTKTYLEQNLNQNIQILGPTTASMYKFNNIYRFQLILKYRHEENLFEVLAKLKELFATKKNVTMDIDINPTQV